jgi:hypothetical protein
VFGLRKQRDGTTNETKAGKKGKGGEETRRAGGRGFETNVGHSENKNELQKQQTWMEALNRDLPSFDREMESHVFVVGREGSRIAHFDNTLLLDEL